MRGATGARWSISGVTSYFNPRAPCGARRRYRCDCAFLIQFQSTRPMRGATQVFSVSQIDSTISIHAPHAGRDAATVGWRSISPRFQSTRPVRGATTCYLYTIPPYRISIHAPRAGATKPTGTRPLRSKSFQSTRPVRARLLTMTLLCQIAIFQSTRPVRARPCSATAWTPSMLFQSTRPVRARHAQIGEMGSILPFQSTRPVRARRSMPTVILTFACYFNPRAPCGRDSKSIQNYFTHFCDKRQFLDNFTQNAAF